MTTCKNFYYVLVMIMLLRLYLHMYTVKLHFKRIMQGMLMTTCTWDINYFIENAKIQNLTLFTHFTRNIFNKIKWNKLLLEWRFWIWRTWGYIPFRTFVFHVAIPIFIIYRWVEIFFKTTTYRACNRLIAFFIQQIVTLLLYNVRLIISLLIKGRIGMQSRFYLFTLLIIHS